MTKTKTCTIHHILPFTLLTLYIGNCPKSVHIEQLHSLKGCIESHAIQVHNLLNQCPNIDIYAASNLFVISNSPIRNILVYLSLKT